MRQRDGRPLYVLFAGVNGAGKSTFYRSMLWRLRDMQGGIERVNADEILLASGGDWRNASDQLRAGKEAVRRIGANISRRKSFNQETTLAGRATLGYLRKARESGFRIVMYYIGVKTPQLADERILHRMQVGGHFVESADVERRYRASMRNLSQAIRLCDEVIVLDNTDEFTCIAQWGQGSLVWIGDVRGRGSWLLDAVSDEETWCPAS